MSKFILEISLEYANCVIMEIYSIFKCIVRVGIYNIKNRLKNNLKPYT